MQTLKKWFIKPDNAPAFGIPVNSFDQAVKYVREHFSLCEEIRICECLYHCVLTTPYMVKTK